MDKKNTMLLTVIAIATLLVAVVGATFAYFSIQADNSGIKATDVTGTAKSTGAITMVSLDKDLSLTLTGTEMVESAQNTPYYATTTPEDKPFLTDQATATYDLATFSLASGETKYDCTYKYAVTITGVDAYDFSGDKAHMADDIKVVFAGAGLQGETVMTVAELKAAGTTGIELSGTVEDLTATVDQKITVYSSFENTTEVQDYLAGINYTITITPDTANAFKCSVAE